MESRFVLFAPSILIKKKKKSNLSISIELKIQGKLLCNKERPEKVPSSLNSMAALSAKTTALHYLGREEEKTVKSS